MSEKNLKQKMFDEIKKTGFPLELRISNFLHENRYYIANNLYYIDRDENKGREIDIRALKNFMFKENDKEYFVRHCVLIECKRSDKPWVIFTSPATSYDAGAHQVEWEGFNNAQLASFLKERKRIHGKLDEIHPFKPYSRRGRSYFEPFKGKETGGTIFKALTTSVKATIARRDEKFASGAGNICFYYPIVVFEGKLFEAYYEHGNLCVEEVDSVIVSFFYESAKYERDNYAVLVITEGSFVNFVSKLDLVLSFWGEEFKKNTKWFST